MGWGGLVHLLDVATVRQGTKQGDGKRGKVVGGEGGVGRARDGARQGDTRGEGTGERVARAEER